MVAHASHTVGSVRVVIVDDAERTRELLRKLAAIDDRLEVVGEAADGHQAIEVTVATCPDVVLLDVRMPGMDGLETLHHLKTDTRVQPAVVMYSADSTRRHEALAQGADGWVDKDQGFSALAEALISAASSRVIEVDEEHRAAAD
jgi:DNA-binding NarL/FixJ family response regulator